MKKLLCILLSCTILTLTGCGLSSRSKNRLFGDKWDTWHMEQVTYTGNSEYLAEIIEQHADDQDFLNDALLSACGDTISLKARVPIVKQLLEAGADPNTESLLIDYIYNYKAYFDVPYMLLQDDRADIDKKGNTEHDALYYALYTTNECEFYSYTQVKMLVDAGAKPYKELFQDPDADSESTYNAVLNSPHSTKLLLEILLESGEESGLPKALEYAFIGRTEEAVKEITSSSEVLDEAQKNVALMYLVYWGTPDQVKAVEDYWGMDFVDKGVLRFAAQTNNADMLQYIVERSGVNLSDQEYYTRDALEYAAQMGNLDACIYLCDNGCATEQFATSRLYILNAAIISENFDVFKTIYDYLSSASTLTEQEVDEALNIALLNRIYPNIFTESDRKVVSFLFENGYDFSEINVTHLNYEAYSYMTEKGRLVFDSDLFDALEVQDVDMFRLAIEKGADVNARKGNSTNQSVIEYAANRGTAYVELLIENGAELPDDILSCVYYSASKKTVEYLIDHGANTDITVDKIPDSPDGSFKTGKSFSLKAQWEAYGRDDLVELLK